MSENKINIILNEYDNKIKKLQSEINDIKKNPESFLSKDFMEIVITQMQYKIEYYFDLAKKWENYRQNLTGKEKDNVY